VKLFNDKSITRSPRELFPREAGMGPSNVLFSKVSTMRLGRSSPMLDGSALPREFACRYRYCREERLKMACGTSPDKLFSPRSKLCKFTNWPSSPGMLPFSWFDFKLRYPRFDSRPNFGGIEPTSKFEDKSKEIKLEQFPSSSGMIPGKLLLFKERYCSCWRWPRGGKGPSK